MLKMSSLYFNPDDEFLHNDNTIDTSTVFHGGLWGGAIDSYADDEADEWVGLTSGLWGGKDEDYIKTNDNINADIIKSNKRFSEKKWLKPTKNSALDEIINMIHDKDAQDDDIKLEVKKSKNSINHTKKDESLDNPTMNESIIELTQRSSKKSATIHTEKGGSIKDAKDTTKDDDTSTTFDLIHGLQLNKSTKVTLPEFDSVLKSQKYQLELRRK